jgi:hypothetical protein
LIYVKREFRVRNLKKGIDLMHAIGSDHIVKYVDVMYVMASSRRAMRVENREIDDEIHEITT